MNNYYFVYRKTWILLLLFISTFAFGQQTSFIDNTPGTAKTWTVPASVTSITVEIWGGGGAGGGSQNNGRGGGGGGGGGYSTKVISVIPGQKIIYTVGKGGTGSTGNGTVGDASTVFHSNSSTSMIAYGGEAGMQALRNSGGSGGSGGKAAGGTGVISGDDGFDGNDKGGNGGNAGNTTNTGGAGRQDNNGTNGSIPGGGGGGGEASGIFFITDKEGGDGGNGQLKITYATPTLTYKAQIISAVTGPITWCPGETRKVSVTIRNTGTAPWITGGGQSFNIGVKWNTNGTSWNDYNVRVSAENLGVGATKTYFFNITASNNLNETVSATPGYTTPLATGDNNLTFDVVFEAVSWFGNNSNGVGPGNTVFTTSTQKISLPSPIGNNDLSYVNGTSGKLSATATEYTSETGMNANLNAPAGTYFSYVNFASYGQPTGTSPNFTIDPACHSATSHSVTESYLLGNSTASIPPTNTVFGDPCVNKLKRLYVLASYATPICKGSSVTITGSVPTGGTGALTYVWESSTTSAKNGFVPAPGLNNLQNYTSGAITQTTWYRRVVTACGTTSTSGVVMVMVDPVNGGAVASAQSICSGTAPAALTLSGHFGTVEKWQRSTDINFTTFTDIANTTTTLTPGILTANTYFRAVVKTSICKANSVPVLITVNPIITPSVSIQVSPTNIICVGADTPLTFTATPVNGGIKPSFQWMVNGIITQSGSNSIFTTSTLKENDIVTVRMTSNASPCLTDSPATSNPITIITQKTVYTTTGWSLLPAPNLSAEIQSAYTISSTLEACKLLITNNAPVTIKTGDYFKIHNGITVDAGSSLTMESDANLVQVNNNPVPPNSGDITSKRTIALRNDRNQYNYLISPVVGQSLKTIYPNIDFVLYYNESNNYFYSSSGAYIPGRGLAVKVPNVNTTGTSVSANFKGVPANGIISFPLAFTNSSRGFNLAGNPYPSTIDLKALYTLNKSIINSTFSYWDNSNNSIYSQQGTSYEGNSYAKYNAVNDTGTPAGGSTILTAGLNRYAKVGQGFIVQALSASSLTFNNTIREIVNHNAKFYGKTGNVKNAEIKDRYWLQLLSPTGIINTQAVVYFAEGDDAFGKDDSEIDGTISDIFYSIADAQKLIIQGKSSFVDTDKVKLGANIFQDGSYKISLENPEGIFASGQTIFLKDKQEGIITNLSEGSYTFSASKGDNSTRFEIIYKPETILATDSKTKEQLIVYKDGSDFVVKSQSKNITGLEVYDTTGRLITKLQPNRTKVIIPAENLVNGVYLLKINQSGVITSKKIIK